MLELAREITNQAVYQFLQVFRYRLTFDGSQYVLMVRILFENLPHRLQLFFVLLSFDPTGFIFYGECPFPHFFGVVDPDSPLRSFIYPRPWNIPVLAVAKESVDTVLEYPAAFMVRNLVAVSVVSVWHSWPHPPVCGTSW